MVVVHWLSVCCYVTIVRCDSFSCGGQPTQDVFDTKKRPGGKSGDSWDLCTQDATWKYFFNDYSNSCSVASFGKTELCQSVNSTFLLVFMTECTGPNNFYNRSDGHGRYVRHQKTV